MICGYQLLNTSKIDKEGNLNFKISIKYSLLNKKIPNNPQDISLLRLLFK